MHQIAYFPDTKIIGSRSSRHYYDIFQMSNSPVKSKALADLQLLQDVAEFKSRFYRSPAARYDLAKPGFFKLLPSPLKQASLLEDYVRMQEMIFGTIPDFSEIKNCLEVLENEINQTHL